MTLNTPFGDVVMEINDHPCEYHFEPLPNKLFGNEENLLFSVEGRYKIIPKIDKPPSFPLRLKCCVDTTILLADNSELETGERYSAASMFFNKTKLCIGSYDELDEEYEKCVDGLKVIDGGLILQEYTTTGIEIYVRETNYWRYAYFCVAWTTLSGDDYSSNGELDVWLAAEPFMSDK